MPVLSGMPPTLAPARSRRSSSHRAHVVRGAVTACLCVVLLGSLGPPASAGSLRVPRQFFGLHDKSMQAYAGVPFGALRLWDSGVTWRDIETSPGVYDWQRLDTLVTAAQAHGVEVTLVLGQTPTFYSGDRTKPPADLAVYRDYVAAAMARYRDFNGTRGVAAYQVWNEGNVPQYWSGTQHQLAQLTQVVAQTRRLVDPGAVVLAPSFAVRLASQRSWMATYQSQQLGGHHVWRYYDANALSLYPAETIDGRLGGPEDSMRLLKTVEEMLARAGVPTATPIWGTEINYGLTGLGTAATPITEKRQVANLMRTYLLGAARGLARMFWYRYDWASLAGGGTIGNTLMSWPGSPTRVTEAGLALGTTEQWLHGTLVGRHSQQPCRHDRRATYTCVVRHAGGVRTILWNPRHAVRVPIPAGARYRQTGNGKPTRFSRAARTMRVSYLPVMVESPR